jgi:hypothetical protein
VDEVRNGIRFDHNTGLFRGARSNIGQSPSSFELNTT